MSISAALGERRTVEVPAGAIDYRERGGAGRWCSSTASASTATSGATWCPRSDESTAASPPTCRWGAHSRAASGHRPLAARPGADRRRPDRGARPRRRRVVANDTGGAVAQWLVGHHPQRLGGLVLTSCDAFEKFPPTPQRYLELTARVPALMWLVAWSVQFRFVQRLPTAYGWVTSARSTPGSCGRSPIRCGSTRACAAT